jgi:transposase-like protein
LRHVFLRKPGLSAGRRPRDAELRAWRSRPLTEKAYPYLFVDARYDEKVRVGARVVSQGVLVVSAVREDGFREILTVEVADTESARRPTRIRSAL